MENKFLAIVEKYIQDNNLLKEQDNVVLGVSGGADSVALLLVLDYLKEKYQLNLFVVHVNHGIRPEAKEEAEYVRSLCDERGISFTLIEEDIPSLSKELSMGTEEAGRYVRYKAFRDKLSEVGGGVIAVAHNKNDRAETMLFNLFRGTGPVGLASINNRRDEIIRPLLCVERSEIEEFLKDQGVAYCTDKSNFSDDYSRNRIRNNIIPAIKDSISNKAIEHMATTADQLSELNDFAKRTCESSFAGIARVADKEVIFDKNKLLQEDIYIRKLLVKRAIDELVPHNKDITHTHIESVLDICLKNGEKSVNLPYSIKAVSSYDELRMERGCKEEAKEYEIVLSIDNPKVNVAGLDITIELMDNPESLDLGENQYTKYFDYDKMNRCPTLRTRKMGDEIIVNSQGGKKKLKDYMIDAKIPAGMRDQVPLITIGSDVVWVIGYRMSEAYKVTDITKKVLKISTSKEA